VPVIDPAFTNVAVTEPLAKQVEGSDVAVTLQPQFCACDLTAVSNSINNTGRKAIYSFLQAILCVIGSYYFFL